MALYPSADQVAPAKPGVLRRLTGWAKRRLLPESATQPRIRARLAILHSAAGRGSLFNFFLRSSSLESHFWVSTSGVVEQYVDTDVRADANYLANPFAISIETESSPSATEPWPPDQFAALVELLVWICITHQIPAIKATAWNGTGIGWHIQFGSPGKWTPVAKSCPGPARIRQMPALTAAVNARLNGTVPPPPPTPTPPTSTEEPLMVTPDDERKIRAIVSDEMNKVRGDVWVTADLVEKRYGSLRGWLAAIGAKLKVTRADAAAGDTYANPPKG